MANEPQYFSIEKVRALRAYFTRMRNISRGKPEYADLDTTLKLCDQLISLMEPTKPEKA